MASKFNFWAAAHTGAHASAYGAHAYANAYANAHGNAGTTASTHSAHAADITTLVKNSGPDNQLTKTRVSFLA